MLGGLFLFFRHKIAVYYFYYYFGSAAWSSDLFYTLGIANVEDVVAADESLTNIALALTIHPLLRVEQLKVHVAIKCDQGALVLHTPFKFDDHWLVNQVDQERLGVDWNRLSISLLSLT